MNDRALCPICQSAEHGCSVRDEGVACYAPTPRVPRSSPRLEPLAARPVARERGAAGSEVVVTFPIPPAAPRVPCGLCGVLVVWISLPAGGRMPVDAVTGEPHRARCPR